MSATQQYRTWWAESLGHEHGGSLKNAIACGTRSLTHTFTGQLRPAEKFFTPAASIGRLPAQDQTLVWSWSVPIRVPDPFPCFWLSVSCCVAGSMSLAWWCHVMLGQTVLLNSVMTVAGTALQGRRCRDGAAGAALQGQHCRDSTAGMVLQGWCCRDGAAGTALQGRRCRDGAAGTVLQGRRCRDGAAGTVLQGRRCRDSTAGMVLQGWCCRDGAADSSVCGGVMWSLSPESPVL